MHMMRGHMPMVMRADVRVMTAYSAMTGGSTVSSCSMVTPMRLRDHGESPADGARDKQCDQ